MRRLHANELEVDEDLVRRLLAESFPDLAAEPVEAVTETGSTNSLYRLGDHRAVRFPRQPGGGASIAKEQAWSTYVAQHVSVAVPHVVGLGAPGHGYEEVWAVTTWLDGSVPRGRLHGAQSVTLAEDLARFLTELRHMPLPAAHGDERLSTYRGEPLPGFDADFRELVDECRDLGLDLDLDSAVRVWESALTAASDVAPARWYHGDLLAENLLVDTDGRLTAVLDFGGLGLGCPDVDLAVAWEVLDAGGRAVFRRALDLDDQRWAASRGWALFLALMTFPYYRTSMPGRCAARLTMARAAIEGT